MLQISTLRFACRMMCVAIEPAKNEQYDPVLLVRKLEKEIRALKQELAMHDTLVSIKASKYRSGYVCYFFYISLFIKLLKYNFND